jgi:Putative peptidoglycan binding domain
MQSELLISTIRSELRALVGSMRPGRLVAALAAMVVAFASAPRSRAATPSAAKAQHRKAHPSSRAKTAASHKKATHSTSRVKKTAHRRRGSAGRPGRKSRRTAARRRRPNTYSRLAHMEIEPSRVEHIQQALIDAGAMQGAPTGQWDTATRDAMARYQSENGFGVTGLPDAKSLMKLGLGPHPLPPRLDKGVAAPATDLEKPAKSPADTAPSATLHSDVVTPPSPAARQ